MRTIHRRRFLHEAAAAAVAGGVGAALGSCQRTSNDGGAAGSVVAYCSVDAVYARPIFAMFTERTGQRVDAVFDTEATKTTGLVQRLLAEKAAGPARAGVWWSSEPFGTMRLAREGVLASHVCEESESRGAIGDDGEASGPAGWPSGLRGQGGDWYGFASRARVFVVNSERTTAEERPRTLADLLLPRWKGRIALARPQFGTTRGHMAAVAVAYGPEGLRGWLEALRENGVRLYDGNATVVRAVANGECHIGLTDTDDVHAGRREGWPVEMVFERNDLGRISAESERPLPVPLSRGMGAMLVPSTVALVRGGPNPAGSARLLAFLLSPATQRALAESDSRNIPVDPDLRREFARFIPPDPARLALEDVESQVEPAMRIVSQTLGGV